MFFLHKYAKLIGCDKCLNCKNTCNLCACKNITFINTLWVPKSVRRLDEQYHEFDKIINVISSNEFYLIYIDECENLQIKFFDNNLNEEFHPNEELFSLIKNNYVFLSKHNILPINKKNEIWISVRNTFIEFSQYDNNHTTNFIKEEIGVSKFDLLKGYLDKYCVKIPEIKYSFKFMD